MNVSNITGAGTVSILFGGKEEYDYEVSGEVKSDSSVINVNIVEKKK